MRGSWSACGRPSPPPQRPDQGLRTSAQATGFGMLPGQAPPGRTAVPAETHVERGPMDRQQVFELIRDRLADFPDHHITIRITAPIVVIKHQQPFVNPFTISANCF